MLKNFIFAVGLFLLLFFFLQTHEAKNAFTRTDLTKFIEMMDLDGRKTSSSTLFEENKTMNE